MYMPLDPFHQIVNMLCWSLLVWNGVRGLLFFIEDNLGFVAGSQSCDLNLWREAAEFQRVPERNALLSKILSRLFNEIGEGEPPGDVTHVFSHALRDSSQIKLHFFFEPQETIGL